ncbi:MAG: hypothetical protein AAF548_00590 [Actinomycetota bacterium]
MRRTLFIGGGLAIGLAVTVALLTLGGEGPFARDRVGTTPWDLAVIGDDGRTLTVSFVGAEEFAEDDPCHVDYSIEADATDDGIVVTVVSREAGGSKFCTLAGLFRSLSVDIGSPLDGRLIIDGHDGRINAVRSTDGRCVQPPAPRPAAAPNDLPPPSSTSTLAPPPPSTDPCDR